MRHAEPDREIVTLRVVGNRLRQLVEARFPSYHACAQCANISVRTLTRAMQGESLPHLEIVFRLALVLNTPIEQIFIVSQTTRPARPQP